MSRNVQSCRRGSRKRAVIVEVSEANEAGNCLLSAGATVLVGAYFIRPEHQRRYCAIAADSAAFASRTLGVLSATVAPATPRVIAAPANC